MFLFSEFPDAFDFQDSYVETQSIFTDIWLPHQQWGGDGGSLRTLQLISCGVDNSGASSELLPPNLHFKERPKNNQYSLRMVSFSCAKRSQIWNLKGKN